MARQIGTVLGLAGLIAILARVGQADSIAIFGHGVVLAIVSSSLRVPCPPRCCANVRPRRASSDDLGKAGGGPRGPVGFYGQAVDWLV